ncbi:MAG TPA: ATP synthase subunit I [Kofleriaceae bacterium]|jgi:hypothetical protein
MGSPSIGRIERTNYILAAVLVSLAAITRQPRDIFLGVLVGSALTSLNFFFLRKLIVKWTADAAAGKQGNAQLLMMPKMIGLMGAVTVCMLFLPLNVVAFTVGFSIFIVSILIEAIGSAVRSAPADSEHNHG